MTPGAHTPVLADEAVRVLGVRPGGLWVDATVGLGGHAELMLKRSEPDGVVVGLDRDGEAIEYVRGRFHRYGTRFVAVNGNFASTAKVLGELGLPRADGVLADLGVSSMQLDSPKRGFSFQNAGPIDMRMDRRQEETALGFLGRTDEKTLARVIGTLGEERASGRVARAIKEGLRSGAIRDTLTLANVVASAAWKAAGSRIHPATKTFQAIRAAVNREEESLLAFLADVPELVRPGGRAAVISFQSNEDRAVKRAFAALAAGCVCPPEFAVCACGRKPRARLVVRGAVAPSRDEVSRNPRARSARLRAIELL